MENQDGSFHLLKEYLGFERRTFLWYLALVAGVVVLVTVIYVSIFGYQTWQTNMQRAGSMMVANLDAPLQGGAGAVISPAAPARVPAVQYVCPTCGAVGLPRWSADGVPRCPSCGAIMSVAGRQQNNAVLAAAP